MSEHILDPETVNAMIPLVQRVANDLETAFEAAARALRSLPEEGGDGAVGADLDQIQHLVDELEKLGGTLRCYEPVRVDFLAEVDGEIGYVCWETGEGEAMHFHGAMERCEGLVLTA